MYEYIGKIFIRSLLLCLLFAIGFGIYTSVSSEPTIVQQNVVVTKVESPYVDPCVYRVYVKPNKQAEYRYSVREPILVVHEGDEVDILSKWYWINYGVRISMN